MIFTILCCSVEKKFWAWWIVDVMFEFYFNMFFPVFANFDKPFNVRFAFSVTWFSLNINILFIYLHGKRSSRFTSCRLCMFLVLKVEFMRHIMHTMCLIRIPNQYLIVNINYKPIFYVFLMQICYRELHCWEISSTH